MNQIIVCALGVLILVMVVISTLLLVKGCKQEKTEMSFIVPLAATMGFLSVLAIVLIFVMNVDIYKNAEDVLNKVVSLDEKIALVESSETSNVEAQVSKLKSIEQEYKPEIDEELRKLNERLNYLEENIQEMSDRKHFERMILSDKSEKELLDLAIARYDAGDYEGVVEIYLSDKMIENPMALRNRAYLYAKGLYFEQNIEEAVDLCMKAYKNGDEGGITEAFAIYADDSWEDGAKFLYENRNTSKILNVFTEVFGTETNYSNLSTEEKRTLFMDKLMTEGENTISTYQALVPQPNHLYELYDTRTEFDPNNSGYTRKKYFYHHYYWSLSDPETYGYLFLR